MLFIKNISISLLDNKIPLWFFGMLYWQSPAGYYPQSRSADVRYY